MKINPQAVVEVAHFTVAVIEFIQDDRDLNEKFARYMIDKLGGKGRYTELSEFDRIQLFGSQSDMLEGMRKTAEALELLVEVPPQITFPGVNIQQEER